MTGASRTQTRAPKVGHKKSRNGCLRCKTRRVKCDEVKPTCGNCMKHGTESTCKYPERPSTKLSTPARAEISSSTTDTYVTSPERPLLSQFSVSPFLSRTSVTLDIPNIENAIPELPESTDRRLLELRLLHNYMHRLGQHFDLPQSSTLSSAWREDVPKLALQHENLLYALWSVSATHMLRDTPEDRKLSAARDSYQVMALGAQRRAIENLSPDNADATCFASIILLINSFGVLHEKVYDRSEGYSPPMQWLLLGKGARSIIDHLLAEDSNANTAGKPRVSRIRTVLTSSPSPTDWDKLDDESARKDFVGLLSQSTPSNDDFDDKLTREAYEKTLNYIGNVWQSVKAEEPSWSLSKRILLFPMFVPPLFLEFVSLRRPRALVILAHFFAITTQVKLIWWLGDAGRKEIEGIKDAVPMEWRRKMMWPLAMAEASSDE